MSETPSSFDGGGNETSASEEQHYRGDDRRHDDRCREQELERFREYRRTGDRRLRNALIEEHRWIATRCAWRFNQRGEPMDDLIQVALLGLLKAVERFDPGFGVSFSTFAVPTVLGELRRHFRDATWAVHVPRRAKELHLELAGAVESLTKRLGRSPSVVELAGWMNVGPDHVHAALEAGMAYRTGSLAARASEEGPEALELSSVVSRQDPDLASTETRLELNELMEELPERERKILFLRFYEGLTQSEIAMRVGVSQVHVSRLLRLSLDTLRGRLEQLDAPIARDG